MGSQEGNALPKLSETHRGDGKDLTKSGHSGDGAGAAAAAGGAASKGTTRKVGAQAKLTPFPPDDRTNPYAGLNFDTHPYKNAILSKTFKGHMMAVSALAMHPKKSIVATASDDFTWKIWTLPQGELIMRLVLQNILSIDTN
jgi:WD40 repeat protein